MSSKPLIGIIDDERNIQATLSAILERRGYAAVQRNSIPLHDQWLSNTTMLKPLAQSQQKTPASKPS